MGRFVRTFQSSEGTGTPIKAKAMSIEFCTGAVGAKLRRGRVCGGPHTSLKVDRAERRREHTEPGKGLAGGNKNRKEGSDGEMMDSSWQRLAHGPLVCVFAFGLSFSPSIFLRFRSRFAREGWTGRTACRKRWLARSALREREEVDGWMGLTKDYHRIGRLFYHAIWRSHAAPDGQR